MNIMNKFRFVQQRKLISVVWLMRLAVMMIIETEC